MSRRVLVIGLDCASPQLVFERYRRSMPHVSSLMERGIWGRMRSSEPPITVPAWTCMTTGRDPGELGLYGFRKRIGYGMAIHDSRDLREKRIWDRIGEAGKKAVALFVPLTSPPTPLRGEMVSCFLHPGANTPRSFPPRLIDDLEDRFGPYRTDIEGFRERPIGAIVEDLFAMAEQHFAFALDRWVQAKPDFLMMVEMGSDRLHHALWQQIDPSHPAHDPRGEHLDTGERYYAFLDAQIGRLLSHVDDETTVLIVSDHGARPMRGAFRINEWLRREGWLVLKHPPETSSPLRPEWVDWERTRAWAEGGYYARIFLNVNGREPQGLIPPTAFEEARTRLKRSLEAGIELADRTLQCRAERPGDVYRRVRGDAPDLMLYVGDLDQRISSVVFPTNASPPLLTDEDERGRDGCNHDWDGIFIGAGSGIGQLGELSDLSLYDFAPTVGGLLQLELPSDLRGRNLLKL